MTDVFNIIEEEVKNYDETTLKYNPSFAPRQQDVLDLIDRYWSSQFRDGDTDSLGYKKAFYNIVNFPVETNAKMLDLDTKDIRLIAENWGSYWPSWLMSKELKMWMKDKYFGRQLNEYCLNWPKYGHLFVKKVDDDVVLVPPQNMIVKPNALSIKFIPIIEKHEYDPDELRQEGKKRNWENVEEAIKALEENEKKVIVYEVYFPTDYLDDEEDNYFIIPKDKGDIMFSDHKKDNPYKDLPWEKVPGRLLGRGQVEKLFEEQIYLNRIANYKAEGLHWTSKHLYQTRDTGIASNLMTKVQNGEILIVNDEISPVPVEERNLHIYREEEDRWMENVKARTFSREPITGGRAPAGTPLGSTILQTQMATGYFEQKKEELGMFIKEILWDWVIPEFKNQKRKEHTLLMEHLIKGDEENSEKFFKLRLNEKMNHLRATSKYLSSDQWKIRKGIQAELLKNGSVEIPRGFYDNLKYKIDIVITGEQIDTSSKLTTLQTVFQILGSNPTILQDKRVRRVFYKMMDLAGINPEDLQLFEEPTALQEMVGEVRAQRGGSIAAPPTASAPATLPEEVKV